MSSRNFTPKHGIICFLDILGTKSKWRDTDAQKLLKNIKKLHDQFSELTSIYRKLLRLKRTSYSIGKATITPFDSLLQIPKLRIDVSIFSDTIVLALYGQNPMSAALPDSFLIHFIGHLLIPIFRRALVNETYLRGSLSIGRFYIYKGKNGISLVGPAVNDAAQSYDTTSWAGISASQSASLTLEQEHSLDGIRSFSRDMTASYKGFEANVQKLLELITSSFVRYDIPRKDGIERMGWALAWPSFFDNGASYLTKDCMNKIFARELSHKKYQEHFESYDIFAKFKNTYLFYNYCRSLREYDCSWFSEVKIK